MKKILTLFLALIVLTTGTSLATSKTAHLKDILSKNTMQKDTVTYVGAYKGSASYSESCQKGIYQRILWQTRDNVSWADLGKALEKELGLPPKTFDRNKAFIWKDFEISSSTDQEYENGKVIEEKVLWISRNPSNAQALPQYLLNPSSQLPFLSPGNPRQSFGSGSGNYLNYPVFFEVLKERNDLRVLYNFSPSHESTASIESLWQSLKLPQNPALNQIVTKDGYHYMFYKDSEKLCLTIGKTSSKTFISRATAEANANAYFDSELCWKQDQPLRTHQLMTFENLSVDVTDIPSYKKDYVSETQIKLPEGISEQHFWDLIKKDCDILGDSYPSQYIQIGKYDMKFSQHTFYMREHVHPSDIFPWYIVIDSIKDDSCQTTQMVRKNNKLVLENYNLGGYNCRIEVQDDGRGKNESVAFFYIDTTDSAAAVWSAFIDTIGFGQDEMFGKISSKDFYLRITGIDGTHVYTKLYKKTPTQIVLKASR